MKKLTKLFSTVAFVSALALVGCANPNGPATDNNNAKPETNVPDAGKPGTDTNKPDAGKPDTNKPNENGSSFDDIAAPNGGSTNNADKFVGKILKFEDTDVFTFDTDGTVAFFNGDKVMNDYKVDSEYLYLKPTGIEELDESTNKLIYKTYDQLKTEITAQVEKDKTDTSKDNPWPDFLDYCKNNKEKATQMMIDHNLNQYKQYFAVTSYKYSINNETNKVTLEKQMPKITSLHDQESIFSYLFDSSEIEAKYHLPMGDMFLFNDLDLWKDNKLPYMEGDNPETKSATWSVTGEGFDQVVTITISETEKYECKIPAETKTHMTIVYDSVDKQ